MTQTKERPPETWTKEEMFNFLIDENVIDTEEEIADYSILDLLQAVKKQKEK